MRPFRWFVIVSIMFGALPVWEVHAQVLSGKIAYSTSTHEVWVMNGDGTASGKRKLADGDGSVFSPDGTRVAFISGAYAPIDALHDIAIKSVKIDGIRVQKQ